MREKSDFCLYHSFNRVYFYKLSVLCSQAVPQTHFCWRKVAHLGRNAPLLSSWRQVVASQREGWRFQPSLNVRHTLFSALICLWLMRLRNETCFLLTFSLWIHGPHEQPAACSAGFFLIGFWFASDPNAVPGNSCSPCSLTPGGAGCSEPVFWSVKAQLFGGVSEEPADRRLVGKRASFLLNCSDWRLCVYGVNPAVGSICFIWTDSIFSPESVKVLLRWKSLSSFCCQQTHLHVALKWFRSSGLKSN